MIYKCKHFQIEELVPRSIAVQYANRPENLWWLFDPKLLLVADELRETFGRFLVNTWLWGGSNQYRGYRPPNCEVGAPLSQHRFGRALDLQPLDASVEQVRDTILGDKLKWLASGISAIELATPTWIHVDTRNWLSSSEIFLFTP